MKTHKVSSRQQHLQSVNSLQCDCHMNSQLVCSLSLCMPHYQEEWIQFLDHIGHWSKQLQLWGGNEILERSWIHSNSYHCTVTSTSHFKSEYLIFINISTQINVRLMVI